MWSMRSSYLNYLYVIITLTVFWQGVKAQYEFRNLFYSFTRNIAPNFNNWQHVDGQYGNGNGFGSIIPSATIQFTYHDENIKTVGDYCNTKGVTGVCTSVNKCPEVLRDIQKGKTPTICSYQSSEVVVCCPKRSTQSNQQVWSSNNNNNNNQYYQISSTNQVYPSNQFNQIYPTQQFNQIYQPYQGNQFNQQSQVYQPTQISQVTQVPPRQVTQVPPRRPTQPPSFVQNNQNNQAFLSNRNPDNRRKSEQKCDDYSKLATHSVSFTSLSILTSTQEVNIPTCTYPTGLIVGGEIAKAGEFPHMAAIGWTSFGEVDWKCGGSLISEYFVLTAGHCSSLYGIPPDIIRLGDQNLVRLDDNAQPQDYQIANVIVHPEYRHSAHYHDIALIRLNRQVIFTRFIRPACLWQNFYINSTKTIATGWGLIEFAGAKSDDLRKVALNIVDNSQCNQLYESTKKLKNGIVSSQMCAGNLEGGKDTCQGDSGGPIQVITPRNQCIFHIVGVTSFGKACAAADAAGVYTRVSSYLDWIESNVWL